MHGQLTPTALDHEDAGQATTPPDASCERSRAWRWAWLLRLWWRAPSLREERGSAVFEMALIFPVLATMMFGMCEFGILLTNMVNLTNAARNGARWAATHPTAWTTTNPAASNTIEGQIQLGAAALVPNDDSHLTITYLVPGGSSTTPCGYYSASSGGFVASNGYTQGTCIQPGNLIQVQITYTYRFMTPFFQTLFPKGVTITPNATIMEEV